MDESQSSEIIYEDQPVDEDQPSDDEVIYEEVVEEIIYEDVNTTEFPADYEAPLRERREK